jgi:hypothetical protein
MNAIDTNLYSYLPEQWKGLYDLTAGSSTDPSGKDGFAAFLASSSVGRAFLEDLESTGALSSAQLDPILNPPAVTASTQDTGEDTTSTDGASASTATTGEDASSAAEGSVRVAANFYDFTQGDWQSRHPDKMGLYGQEPGMGVFLAENPEYGSLFVNGTLDQAAAVCGVYERSLYGQDDNSGQVDVTT